MSAATKSPLALANQRAGTEGARRPVKNPTPHTDHNTLWEAWGGALKESPVYFIREDGLCSNQIEMIHTHIPDHRVRLGPIDNGWGALCICGRVGVADTEGEIRRWAELHFGVYRPMRPN